MVYKNDFHRNQSLCLIRSVAAVRNCIHFLVSVNEQCMNVPIYKQIQVHYADLVWSLDIVRPFSTCVLLLVAMAIQCKWWLLTNAPPMRCLRLFTYSTQSMLHVITMRVIISPVTGTISISLIIRLLYLDFFTAWRSYASTVLGVVILSVRLSVTRVLCD